MYDARTRLAAQVADEVRDPLQRYRAAHDDPAVGADLRGAELRPDGDDVRPRFDRRAVLSRGGPRDGAASRDPQRDGGRTVTDKRRGLGRGLGALIPTAPGKGEAPPSGPSPVDVLIPARTPRRRCRRRRIRPATPAATGGADADAQLPPWWTARTSPRCRWTPSRPNPRQPRVVFDEEALAELVHSLREVGLLQPVVVRPLGDGPLRADHGRAPVAGRPGGRLHRHPGDRPGDRRRRSCCATRCWRTCTAAS